MSMSLQVEAGSSYQDVGAALFASTLLAPPARMYEQHAAPAKADNRLDVPLSELNFRHLQSAEAIAGIVHLRNEIQLVAASGADPSFIAREKKETRRALSPHSSAAARLSGRFASFR